ncbi:MAG: TetR/AcrR family transcriptional regulator [Clostridia bacterium]|nr:TetR/AcrR family transcriptional regulator [Clostridia bacterium]
MKSEDIRQQNYEKIKSTASVLFFIQGIEATNIYQIAAASGISKVSLYKHFESKYDIAKAILYEHIQQNTDRLAAEWTEKPGETGASQMRRLLENLSMTIQDDMVFYALFLEYAMYLQRSHKSQIPEFFAFFEASVHDLFMSALQKGREDGSLKQSGSPREMFETVTGTIRGTCMLFFLRNAGSMSENALSELNDCLNHVIDGCMLMLSA